MLITSSSFLTNVNYILGLSNKCQLPPRPSLQMLITTSAPWQMLITSSASRTKSPKPSLSRASSTWSADIVFFCCWLHTFSTKNIVKRSFKRGNKQVDEHRSFCAGNLVYIALNLLSLMYVILKNDCGEWNDKSARFSWINCWNRIE